MPEADLVIIGVMGRGNFDKTGSKIRIHIGIGNDGNGPVSQGQAEHSADQGLVAGVIRMNGNRRVCQHGLRAGGGNLNPPLPFCKGIADGIKTALPFLMLDLDIRDGGGAAGTPIDHALAPVDQALPVEVDKDLADSLGQALIHGETMTLPVTGEAKTLLLFNDPLVIFVLPKPGPFQEALSPNRLLGQAFLAHPLDHHSLGGDGGMVGTGQKEGVLAPHPLESGQDIGQGIVQGMAHMKLASDIGWRHNDAKRFLVRGGWRMEGVCLQPGLVDGRFLRGRFKAFRNLINCLHG